MSRAYQIERMMEREEEALSQRLSDGLITVKQYNHEMAELQRDARGAMEEDERDAVQAVRADYGIW